MQKIVGFLLFALMLPVAYGKDYVIDQQDKKFALATITAKVGDKLVFTNSDQVSHNVYSVSEIQQFDLGTYREGDVVSVVLEKPGLLEVECVIHPRMYLRVNVLE